VTEDEARAAEWRETQLRIRALRLAAARALAAPTTPYREMLADWGPLLPGQPIPLQLVGWDRHDG
jgi:hypothetical protein